MKATKKTASANLKPEKNTITFEKSSALPARKSTRGLEKMQDSHCTGGVCKVNWKPVKPAA